MKELIAILLVFGVPVALTSKYYHIIAVLYGFDLLDVVWVLAVAKSLASC